MFDELANTRCKEEGAASLLFWVLFAVSCRDNWSGLFFASPAIEARQGHVGSTCNSQNRIYDRITKWSIEIEAVLKNRTPCFGRLAVASSAISGFRAVTGRTSECSWRLRLRLPPSQSRKWTSAHTQKMQLEKQIVMSNSKV